MMEVNSFKLRNLKVTKEKQYEGSFLILYCILIFDLPYHLYQTLLKIFYG
jgi:hypothetical protein